MKKLSALMAAVMLLAVFAFTSSSQASFTEPDNTVIRVDRGSIESRMPFNDVAPDSWYYTSAEFAYQHSLVNGTSDNTFSPDIIMIRGMFVTLLGRLDGANISDFSHSRFSDVADGEYYAPYVEWAADAEIVTGYGDGVFAPGDPITREQLALLLKNYCDFRGIETKNTGISLDAFTDRTEISSWSYDAMSWAVENSVISGMSETQLAPKNSAPRSHTVQLIYNYLLNLRHSAATDFTVSRAFSDGMVLQRGKDVSVWGFAPEEQNGKTVTAEFRADGELISSETAIIENGEWELILNRHLPVYDTAGCTLTVYGNGQSFRFEEILVGDVYMIIGQSNVNYSLSTLLDNDIGLYNELSSDPSWTGLNMRFLRNSATDWTGQLPQGSAELMNDLSSARGWTSPDDGYIPGSGDFMSDIITPTSTLGSFSAIGVLTALDMANNTGIPIGMVEVDAAGCQLSAFMPNSLCEEFECDIPQNQSGATVYVDEIIRLSSRWIYNQMIYPLQRLSLSGILWYQGESDLFNTTIGRGEEPSYVDEFTAFAGYLRENFTNHDIPIFMVELPTIFECPEWYTGQWHFMDFGNIRSDMGLLANTVKDLYFAASGDVWQDSLYYNNLHPYCKAAQSERLLSLIYARVYSDDASLALEYSAGPHIDSVEFNGNSAEITYRYTADGIQAMSEVIDNQILGFDVYVNDPASGNKMWIGQCGYGATGETLTAVITADDKITLSLNSLEIIGIRYNARCQNMFGTGATVCSKSETGTYIPAIAYCEYK